MSQDAMDHRHFCRFGKEQKREFAKAKAEEAEREYLTTPKSVISASEKFRAEIEKQRRAAGLDVKCGLTGMRIPPEDAGRCNNAEGCDACPHSQGQ